MLKLDILDLNGRVADPCRRTKIGTRAINFLWMETVENLIAGIYIAEFTVNGNKSVSKLVVK